MNCIRCPKCKKLMESHIHCKCAYPIYIKLDKKRERNRKKEVESLKYEIEILQEIVQRLEAEKNGM